MINFRKIGSLPEFKSLEMIKVNDGYGDCQFPKYKGSQVPSPVVLDNDFYVFFSAVDRYNRSFPFYFKLDKTTLEAIEVSKNPVFDLGNPGEWDSDGCIISQVNGNKKQIIISYTGVNEGVGISKFRNSCGKSFIVDDKVIKNPYPTIDRTESGPCGSSMMFEHQNYQYYVSYERWEKSETSGEVEPIHTISSKSTTNFINSRCIPLEKEHGGVTRPVVFNHENDLYMMYSARGKHNYLKEKRQSYKLRLARYSKALHRWVAVNPPVVYGSEGDFMYVYAYPFKIGNRLILFYNNSFTGPIQIAELC